ncbi:MAG: O-methyltransferase [bacterium]|nr:O-methyltransferase [bacterium]MCP5070540.1 O-methyltransferase [bacterium]
MSNERMWQRVDEYLCDELVEHDPILEAVLTRCERAGMPAINVAPNQGKLLMLLARIQGAARILEVGTLGGYSTIWLARGLAEAGHLDTLEVDSRHAAIAEENLDQAGLRSRVQVHVGPAIDTLARLRDEHVPPYDYVFIDADKPSNPEYLRATVALSRPGTLIIVDNVIRGGGVIDTESDDPRVHGVRRMNEMIRQDTRLSATAVQTVGSKGWDGFALVRVSGD